MLYGKRNEKIALQIKGTIAEALIHEMRDPRIGFVTVTAVELSDDLKHAAVYVSVMGNDKEREGALIALNHATGFFQKTVAGNLTLRFTPKIRFVLDRSVDEGMKIDTILAQLRAEEGPDGTADDTAHDTETAD